MQDSGNQYDLSVTSSEIRSLFREQGVDGVKARFAKFDRLPFGSV
jgi:hypothetical protein